VGSQGQLSLRASWPRLGCRGCTQGQPGHVQSLHGAGRGLLPPVVWDPKPHRVGTLKTSALASNCWPSSDCRPSDVEFCRACCGVVSSYSRRLERQTTLLLSSWPVLARGRGSGAASEGTPPLLAERRRAEANAEGQCEAPAVTPHPCAAMPLLAVLLGVPVPRPWPYSEATSYDRLWSLKW